MQTILFADASNQQYSNKYHSLLGLLYLQNQDIQSARRELSHIQFDTEPRFSLACKLLEVNDKDVVHKYLRRCRTYYDMRSRDASSRRISTWIKTLEQNQIPDLGKHCGFE